MADYDNSMHCGVIQRDTTSGIPQVVVNTTRYKNTVSFKRTHSFDELSSEDENDKNNKNNNEDDPDINCDFLDNDYLSLNRYGSQMNYEEDEFFCMSEDDYDDIQQLDVLQKKNKNIISISPKKKKIARNQAQNQNQNLKSKSCCYKLYDSCCYSLPILHPHGNLRITWDCLIMIILIYTCIEIPFSLAFQYEMSIDDTLGRIALLIDCLLLFDVILNFRTAYFDIFDQMLLIWDPQRIAFKYFTTWFLLDFSTSIPFEFLLPNSESASNFPTLLKVLRIFRMIRLLKLLRFFRMLKTFNSIISSFMTRSIIILLKLFKLLCLMTLSAHYVACIWFYVGYNSYLLYGYSWLSNDSARVDLINDSSTLEQYMTSFYFAVVTLYTTGYGDIVPISIEEKVACSMCILVGTCFFAYFIGAVGALVAEGDRVHIAQIQKIEEAQAFCVSKKLPQPIAHALMSHSKYHWKRNFVFDDMDVMNSLPGYLRRDVGNCLSEKFFNKLCIFKDLSPYIRGLIALRLRCVSCNANYELYHSQQYGKEMFIQRTGISYLLDNNKNLHKILRGGVCGYYSLLSPVRITTLKCISWCEFYALDRDDIQDILRINFPRGWVSLWRKIKKRINDLKDAHISNVNINIKKNIFKNMHSNSNSKDNNKLPIPKNPKYTKLVNCKSTSTINSSTTDLFETDSDNNNSGTGTTQRNPLKMNPFLRKSKKIFNISDSEMRNYSVSKQPPLKKLNKSIKKIKLFEKKLRIKMLKKRWKRQFRGIEEIIPIVNKHNNHDNVDTGTVKYFDKIMENENNPVNNDNDNDDDSVIETETEESYYGSTDEEEYVDSDDNLNNDILNGAVSAPLRRRRGVNVGGGIRKGGGFKGVRKVKMNQRTHGIKSIRSSIKRKKKKKKKMKKKMVNNNINNNKTIHNFNDIEMDVINALTKKENNLIILDGYNDDVDDNNKNNNNNSIEMNIVDSLIIKKNNNNSGSEKQTLLNRNNIDNEKSNCK